MPAQRSRSSSGAEQGKSRAAQRSAPLRSASSSRMLTVSYGTAHVLSTCTHVLLKPHCARCAAACVSARGALGLCASLARLRELLGPLHEEDHLVLRQELVDGGAQLRVDAGTGRCASRVALAASAALQCSGAAAAAACGRDTRTQHAHAARARSKRTGGGAHSRAAHDAAAGATAACGQRAKRRRSGPRGSAHGRKHAARVQRAERVRAGRSEPSRARKQVAKCPSSQRAHSRSAVLPSSRAACGLLPHTRAAACRQACRKVAARRDARSQQNGFPARPRPRQRERPRRAHGQGTRSWP
jgi:hypothetical protein